MALNIQTFVNPAVYPHDNSSFGGKPLFKALGHPLAADRKPELVERFRSAQRLAIYDPLGYAEVADQFFDLAGLTPVAVYVQRVEDIGRTVLGRTTQMVNAIASDTADLLLVSAFDADRFIAQIAPLLPESLEIISFDALRLPNDMLSNRKNYLAPINFATNFVLFRDEPDQHTVIVTVNYWSLYGARRPTLWCRLFDADGAVLAEWRQDLPAPGGVFRIDSREVRARFDLGRFCGTLFLHAVNIAGHDIIKYALDTYGDGNDVLSCSHDANPWPADRYAGLPAPDIGERVLLWIQNSHPLPIPARSIGINLMGCDEIRWFDDEIPPFGTCAVDCGSLLPEAKWPDQLEVRAGKHCVRPRYEVMTTGNGRRRLAHVNVERDDLQPDPAIARQSVLLGKGYILPLPVPPIDRFSTLLLPTPMTTAQVTLPLSVLLIDASGEQVDARYLGVVPRNESVVVDVDAWLSELSGNLNSGYGHLELVYDFRDCNLADSWLHAIGRYAHRNSGHKAETSFGAHIFNLPITFRDEPQSYAGTPPGLTTRLFLRLGRGGSYDTFCHLIYPASKPWRAKSATDLNLIDGEGNVIASHRIEIPCGGSLFCVPLNDFDKEDLAKAGDGAYIQIRDTTCRLFGYQGLTVANNAFSLDHMFGF